MPTVGFKARLRRWGNTFGITVSPKEVAKLGAREGQELSVEASTELRKPDFSGIAVMRTDDPLTSERHDHYAGAAALEDHEGRRRRKRGRAR